MHIIRLRGPWEKQVDGRGEVIRVDVPDIETPTLAVAEAGDRRASILYSRNFNLPSGLDPQDRVRLNIAAWLGRLRSVRLNGRTLAIGDAPLRIDLTDRLQRHNSIRLELHADAGEQPRLCGEVTLSIEPTRPCERPIGCAPS